MRVQHVVLFSFDPPLDDEAARQMLAQVREWPARIGGFEVLRIGPPATAERTRGYHYLLHMVVPDEGALATYQEHPVHRRFAEWVAAHGGSSLAFDYGLDARTAVHPHDDGVVTHGSSARTARETQRS